MEIYFECTYCGNKWFNKMYSKIQIKDEKCLICNDKNIITREKNADKINYYQGSPPFEFDQSPEDDDYSFY